MNTELLNKLKEITPEESELLSSGKNEINRSIYMRENSAEIDKLLLLEKGKLISLRPHTRFVHFPPHTHNYIEMVYMCEGSTRHIVNGNNVTLNHGELLILGYNALQEIYPAGKDDIAVNFIILPQFFDTAISMLDDGDNQIRDFLVGCLCEKSIGAGYLHFKVSDILPIQNLIENLIWTLVNHQANKRSINQLTMGLLFLQLSNHTDALANTPKFENQHFILTVLRYIEEHYQDAMLSEIAGSFHCDIAWLSREIKRQSGMTFTELLQNKRLSQAEFLLRTTKLNIIDIAENIGYDNISYFHRIFRKKFGLSPHKYRNANKDTFSVK